MGDGQITHKELRESTPTALAKISMMLPTRCPEIEIDEVMYNYVNTFMIYASRHFTKEEKKAYINRVLKGPAKGTISDRGIKAAIATVLKEVGNTVIVRNLDSKFVSIHEPFQMQVLGTTVYANVFDKIRGLSDTNRKFMYNNCKQEIIDYTVFIREATPDDIDFMKLVEDKVNDIINMVLAHS
jgi:hypothetical protein